ncbi:hypothetical protein DV515_00009497 [Chloebia gouldiae]|uniref:Uncharacterized protein n=1 Tax=Chloebia gouldiae TaxID=44316 RepID=A0A3L8SD27_CHLGU|nr:hypothetical protein DV515_00009497 [Chloebia gouldiae]
MQQHELTSCLHHHRELNPREGGADVPQHGCIGYQTQQNPGNSHASKRTLTAPNLNCLAGA